MTEMGKWLLAIGITITLIGGFFLLAGRFQLLSWFGRLPGDIHWKSDSVEVFIPWVSMLLISVFLSIILQLFALLKR